MNDFFNRNMNARYFINSNTMTITIFTAKLVLSNILGRSF